MFEKEVYIERRQKLKKQVGNGLILLLGNEESRINFKNNTYPFRQDSTFLYFFGIDRPYLCGIIDVDNNAEIIFGDNPTIDHKVFLGDRESLESSCDCVGISAVKCFRFAEDYVKKFKGKVHFLPPYRPENAQKISDWLDIEIHLLENKASVTLIKAIVMQRSSKSDVEIKEIEKGVNLTIDMQLIAHEYTREGVTEAQIADKVRSIADSAGGSLSFPAIITVEGHVLHNNYKGNTLQKGDMLLCDCGAETGMHYAGDLTRTFPVGDNFTTKQKEIYQIVMSAHNAAVDALKPGRLFRDTHLLACEKLVEGLKMLGLMKGDVQEAVNQGAHTMFFQCGLGHLMGLDVHDMEDLGEQYVGYTDHIKQCTQFGFKSLRLGREVQRGFVLTVEPGIYFIPQLIDLWKAEKKFTSFINYIKLEEYRDFTGIRIENDFVITDQGSRKLGRELSYNLD
ncbi:MAG: aminopeptidase P N-terminal domain-containing protein [Cyclobacteriaceae bacterium]